MSPDNRHLSHAAVWLAGAVVATMLYGLSIGPVIYSVVRVGFAKEPPHWVGTLYAPVNWTANHTPLGPTIRAYVGWWIKQACRA